MSALRRSLFPVPPSVARLSSSSLACARMSGAISHEVAMIRTSLTHPLRIDAVSAGSGFGRVGVTFCPGKRQLDAATGAWRRDLGADLDAIAAWGAAAVVTLIEPHEMTALGVAGIEAAVARRHMAWYHLPIADADVPGDAFEDAWRRDGEALRAILRSGFDIVVHCKGGLGRAGMIAARLMVELGAIPDAAVEAVRAVRPGAIETRAQEACVRSATPVAELIPSASSDAVRDRALGCLLGLAVGDAIGTTLEFKARDSFPHLTGMVGGGPFGLAPGQWTDDTAMALALADSLAARGGIDERDLMDRFVSWWKNGTYSCTGRCFDIGVTTSQALGRYLATGDPVAGSTDPRSAGNGSLMRLAPVALWGVDRSEAEVRDAARRQSATTHAAPQAIAACEAYAAMLLAAIGGAPRGEAMASTPTGEATTDAIIAGSWRDRHRADIRSSGYVAHSLEAALWCVGRTGSFADAVLLAANLGNDADTTAAITGQLAGALYGMAGIPDDWLGKLAWRERIEAMAEGLLR